MTVDWEVAILASDPPEFLELGGGVVVVGGVKHCLTNTLKPSFPKDFDLGPLGGADLRRCTIYSREDGRSSSFGSIRTEGVRIVLLGQWR